jgi:hypothetical protein
MEGQIFSETFYGVQFPVGGGAGNWLLFKASRLAPGHTQPHIQWVPGFLSPRLKQPARQADHSHLSSAEIKNAWSYTSTPPYVFVVWDIVKHRDKFTNFTKSCTMGFSMCLNLIVCGWIEE